MAYQIGQVVTFRDCYGSNPKTGKIIERTAYSSLIDVNGKRYTVADCLVVGERPEEETKGKGNEEQFSLI